MQRVITEPVQRKLETGRDTVHGAPQPGKLWHLVRPRLQLLISLHSALCLCAMILTQRRLGSALRRSLRLSAKFAFISSTAVFLLHLGECGMTSPSLDHTR